MATSYKNFLNGIGIIPKSVSESTEKGDIEFLTTDDKLYYYNGSVNDPLVSETVTATLTNKTLTSPVLNTPTADTITGIAGGALTIQSASNQNLSLQAQGSGSVLLESLTISGSSISNTGGSVTIEGISIDSTVITGASMANGTGTFTFNTSGAITAPNGTDTLAGISLSQTLTNKTIAAGSNTITGLTNSNLSGSAGITNANLANSSITINGSSVSLGGSVTVTATATNTLTIGTGLSGTSYNGSAPVTITIDNTVVTLTGSQALSNKTLTSPVINTPTADTITGIAGGALTIQSASNQNLSLQAQGSGSVLLEGMTISGTTITDVATLTNSAGDITLEGITHSSTTNSITGAAATFLIQSASNQNLSLQAQGSGSVLVESTSFSGSTIAGTTGTFIIEGASNQDLIVRASGTGEVYFQKDATTVAYVDTAAFVLANNTELQLREASGSGSNYIGIKAPSTLSGDYSITLPSSPPSANDALVYNGSAYVWQSSTTIADGSVTNAKLADMATQTFKGRTTAGTGVPEDLTATQATAILNAFTGDSGSGGVKGLVPAPSSGDNAAEKFLKAGGTWVAPFKLVGARAKTTNAQAITNGSSNVITTWTTEDYDTDTAFNSTTGVFTVPSGKGGYYRISACIGSASTAWTTGSNRYVQLNVTGTKSCEIGFSPILASVTNYVVVFGTTVFNYSAGDTISITLVNSSGSTFTLSGASTENWISIERVGT